MELNQAIEMALEISSSGNFAQIYCLHHGEWCVEEHVDESSRVVAREGHQMLASVCVPRGGDESSAAFIAYRRIAGYGLPDTSEGQELAAALLEIAHRNAEGPDLY